MNYNYRLPSFIILLTICALMLFGLLWQNSTYGSLINYSGLVRGATQRVIKSELNGTPDGELIAYLDEVYYGLLTGEGTLDIPKSNQSNYQEILAEAFTLWEEIKEEIFLLRQDPSRSTDNLYQLSEAHFILADELTFCADTNSTYTATVLGTFLAICILLSTLLLFFLDKRHHRLLDISVSTDNLTGLLNRTGFHIVAERQLQGDTDGHYIIVGFDVNNFKHINSFYGYATGDQVLKQLSTALMQWRAKNCVIARLDADDFILLTKSSPTLISELSLLLQGALDSLALPAYLSETQFTFGAYEIQDNHELIRTAIDKAYTAHKMAKQQKDTSILWYNHSLIEKIEREQYYIAHMAHALEHGEFKLYLQPQVNLRTKWLMGSEALVRWVLPSGEMVFPDAFIPIFESNGTIVLLDFYMLHQACAYLQEQRQQGKPILPISVNFSRVTICQPNFSNRVIEVVDRFDLPHDAIDIEVVETALNEMGDEIIQMLTTLRQAGFLISMDDFGAGYSSLSILGDLPVQIVKLDRQFLWGIDANSKRKTIIHSFVDMAHRLDLTVICEGVENVSHVNFLNQVGCTYTQGYYFSRPVPKEDFDQVVGICIEKLAALTVNV